MAIILTFVETNTTVDEIESVFEDTFGQVLGSISLSEVKKNRFGLLHRTAVIEFSSRPSDLERWIKIIRDTGSNSLCYKKGKYWSVSMLEQEAPKSKPKILF